MMGESPRPRPLPWKAGQEWVRQGFALIGRQPLRLMVLGMFLQLLAAMSQVGILGLLFILAVPAFSAGMLQAMDVAARGGRPPMLSLFAAFSNTPRLLRLLSLGGLGLACAILVAGLMLSGALSQLDPDVLARLEAGDTNAVNDMDPAIIQRVFGGLLLGLLITGCISYFAVPLIWFTNLPLGQAILQGLVAMLRQWRAFLVMGLLLGLMSVPVAVLTVYVLAEQVLSGATSPLLTLLMLLVAVFYQLLLFSTQYASFRALFVAAEAPPAEESDDQLVA